MMEGMEDERVIAEAITRIYKENITLESPLYQELLLRADEVRDRQNFLRTLYRHAVIVSESTP